MHKVSLMKADFLFVSIIFLYLNFNISIEDERIYLLSYLPICLLILTSSLFYTCIYIVLICIFQMILQNNEVVIVVPYLIELFSFALFLNFLFHHFHDENTFYLYFVVFLSIVVSVFVFTLTFMLFHYMQGIFYLYITNLIISIPGVLLNLVICFIVNLFCKKIDDGYIR